MSSRCSYVTMLSTDHYLAGVLVLKCSLQLTRPQHPFHCLVTPNISSATLTLLEKNAVAVIPVGRIANPQNHNPQDRKFYNYSKLNVWGMNQFSKVVYLDADMIVMHNIDELFDRPHMSSVNAERPIKPEWTQMNGGLFVVEPNRAEFEDMLLKVGRIENGTARGDQAFFHTYYADWPEKHELHLPLAYNVFHSQLDDYGRRFGFFVDETVRCDNSDYDERRIKIVHYIGHRKPWDDAYNDRVSRAAALDSLADRLWLTYWKRYEKDCASREIVQGLRSALRRAALRRRFRSVARRAVKSPATYIGRIATMSFRGFSQ